MRPRPIALILLTSFFITLPLSTPNAAAQQTNPPYLSQFPSVEKVLTAMKTADPRETAIRQMGAFYQLTEIIKTLSGRREFRGFTPDEQRVLGIYQIADYNIGQAASKAFPGVPKSGEETEFHFGRWDQRFGVTGIQTFQLLPPSIRAEFDRIVKAERDRRGWPEQPNSNTDQPVQSSAAPSLQVKTETKRPVPEMTREQADAYDRYFKLGNSYLDSKQYEEAIVAHKKAIAVLPDISYAHNGLGLAYYRLGRNREAVTELKEAVRLDPDDPTAYRNLGLAYSRLKEYSNAAATFERFVRLKPNDADAHGFLGTVYKSMKQYDKAVTAFKEAVRLNPADSSSWAGLGFSYYYLERDSEALSALQQAIRIDPKDTYAYRGLGYVYVDLGRKEDAMSVYKTLLALDKAEAQRVLDVINEKSP